MEPIYVGRQPIFTRNLELFAYELLFRGQMAPGTPFSGDVATSHVLVNSIMDMGLENLVGHHPAFINLSEGFLDGSYPLPAAPEQVMLEVLEDVAPTPTVLMNLKRLRERGYTIALDDFVYRPELEPLLKLAQIVKLDVQALSADELRDHYAFLRQRPVQLLAEKVETHEEYHRCRDMGFDLFQGYFLARPEVVEGRAGKADQSVIMSLIARLQDPDADLEELEQLIVQDVRLTWRLLRHVNSACFALRREVESVREAIVFLGTHTIRNWACLLLLTRVDRKPRELINTALVRAKMCEQLAVAQRASGPHAYFTTGLFSMLDAFIDRPLHDLLESLPLSRAIKAALLKFEGHMGETLQRVMWYEKAAWDRLEDGAVDGPTYTRSYVEALRWANASVMLTD
ncbi:MAG TPA: HDOD domain-containing protein [Geothrix sp.]|nr:HDOD domain-containing protein [Geothrix sp.]